MFHLENSSDVFGQDLPVYTANVPEYKTLVQFTTNPGVTSMCYEPDFNVYAKNCVYEQHTFSNSGSLCINTKNQYYAPVKFTNNSESCSNLQRSFKQHFCTNKQHGVTKTITKKKRKRTMFTTEQIIALEEVFNRKPYITREERMALTRKLQISEKSVKVWFQNRRRLTDKRTEDYCSDSPSSEDMSDTHTDRLTEIEMQINERTDENGFVILDNKTLSELANVIDEFLSHDLNSVDKVISPVTSECKVIYEPISPVSLSETTDEIAFQRIESLSQEIDRFTNIKSVLFF